MESKGRQRGRGLVSLTVPPSRHWLGPLGPALVASAGCGGWGGSRDLGIACWLGFLSSPLISSFCSLGYDDLKRLSQWVLRRQCLRITHRATTAVFHTLLKRQAGGKLWHILPTLPLSWDLSTGVWGNHDLVFLDVIWCWFWLHSGS